MKADVCRQLLIIAAILLEKLAKECSTHNAEYHHHTPGNLITRALDIAEGINKIILSGSTDEKA